MSELGYIPEGRRALKLLEEALEDLYELRGERHWWKDEPRCGRAAEYEELSARIEEIKAFLADQALEREGEVG